MKIVIVILLLFVSCKVMSQIDMKTNKYKSIVISDVHLGLRDSKAEDCIEFLKNNTSDNLFLAGDIIDGWQLGRGGKWTKTDSKFMKKIMKIANDGTKVIYLRGNHDDFLETLIPFFVGDNFEVDTDYIYESFGKKYLIIHGDIFDPITTQATWLAKLGSIGYDILLWLNRHENQKRLKKGLPYKSISQDAKKKVKFIINLLANFENAAVAFAKQKHCDGVICGHIHTPENKMVNGIHYLNSGDWVETKSALVEDFNGEWKIIYY